MTFVAAHLFAEGIRGINSKINLDLSSGLNIIFGSNGSGKTSILQSIEWCLTGELPYLRGPDFRKEDAYVNLFNATKKAKATLTLVDGKEQIIVTRTRNMGKTTTSSSSLEINHKGKTLFDDEAQEHLARVLGIEAGNFPRASYLHQEAIQQLISEEPKERSEAIDKILGTSEIRELAECLNVHRTIKSKADGLNSRIQTLQRDKIQFAVNTRQRLNQKKTELLGKGYKQDDLTLENAVIVIGNLSSELDVTATSMGASVEKPPLPDPSITSINAAVVQLEDSVKKLDRWRIDALQKLQHDEIRIEKAWENFVQTDSEFREYSGATPSSLSDKKSALQAEVDQARNAGSQISSLLVEVTRIKTKLDSNISRLTEAKSEITALEKETGSEDAQTNRISELDRSQISIHNEIEKCGSLNQIVSLSAEYIQANSPSTCPTCGQLIDHEKVLFRLLDEEKNSSKEVRDLRLRERDTSSDIMSSRKKLDQYRSLKKESQSLLNARTKLLGEISEKLGTSEVSATDPDIDALTQKWKNTNELAAKKSQELDTVSQQLRELSSLWKKKIDLRKELEELLGQLPKGADDNALREMVDKSLWCFNEKAKAYQGTATIDALSGQISKLEGIVEYLISMDELGQIENDIPSISALIEDLTARVSSLNQLDGSFAAIREAASEYQKEVVMQELSSLESRINEYYVALSGHPSFPNLKITFESKKEEQPPVYSIKAFGQSSSTYVPTRFSTAQANTVAISLFLSNHDKIADRLSSILMDDPEQNLDSNRQHLLSKLIAKLSSEHQLILCTQEETFKNNLIQDCNNASVLTLGNWSEIGLQLVSRAQASAL